MKLLLLLFIGSLAFPPEVRAEDWQVVWKDDMQELRIDRDSIRVEAPEVEYWYSDEV